MGHLRIMQEDPAASPSPVKFSTLFSFIFPGKPKIPRLNVSVLNFLFLLCSRNKRVCIDLSCWIVQLQNVTKTHCGLVKDKPYIRNLFHRLRALIALNCSLIFVAGIYSYFFV